MYLDLNRYRGPSGRRGTITLRLHLDVGTMDERLDVKWDDNGVKTTMEPGSIKEIARVCCGILLVLRLFFKGPKSNPRVHLLE